MKKIIISMFFILLILVCVFMPKSVEAETYTTYQEMVFDDSDVELIDNWSYMTYNGYLAKLKKKGFGWSVYYATKKAKFSFVAETLYHVKNSGLEEITHTFKYEESYEETIQKSVKGSLETEVSYNKEKKKESKFKFGLESNLDFSIESTEKTKTTETDTVKIIIAPNTELFIKVQGEGVLYQGTARRYFFWIKGKEGAFEYAIITTEYYSIDMNVIDESKEATTNEN